MASIGEFRLRIHRREPVEIPWRLLTATEFDMRTIACVVSLIQSYRRTRTLTRSLTFEEACNCYGLLVRLFPTVCAVELANGRLRLTNSKQDAYVFARWAIDALTGLGVPATLADDRKRTLTRALALAIGVTPRRIREWRRLAPIEN